MKRFVCSFVAVLALNASVFAYSNIPVSSLGVSGDMYTFDASVLISGHPLGIHAQKLQQDIAGYYSAGCNCYNVPLTALGWQTYTFTSQNVTVKHFVPGSGGGCSGGFCLAESIVEILS